MSEPVHRLTLAIPASLKPTLDQMAQDERRSLTKQIIVLLEKAIRPDCRHHGGVPTTEGALQG